MPASGSGPPSAACSSSKPAVAPACRSPSDSRWAAASSAVRASRSLTGLSRAERISPPMLATAAIALSLATAGPNVDNPYFPLPVGRHWTYREGHVRDVVRVTDRTKLMANGVTARVVHDASTLHGVPVEITDDYYAQ